MTKAERQTLKTVFWHWKQHLPLYCVYLKMCEVPNLWISKLYLPPESGSYFQVGNSYLLSFPQDLKAALDPAADSDADVFSRTHTNTHTHTHKHKSHPTRHSDHHPGPTLLHRCHASAAAKYSSNPTLMMQRWLLGVLTKKEKKHPSSSPRNGAISPNKLRADSWWCLKESGQSFSKTPNPASTTPLPSN